MGRQPAADPFISAPTPTTTTKDLLCRTTSTHSPSFPPPELATIRLLGAGHEGRNGEHREVGPRSSIFQMEQRGTGSPSLAWVYTASVVHSKDLNPDPLALEPTLRLCAALTARRNTIFHVWALSGSPLGSSSQRPAAVNPIIPTSQTVEAENSSNLPRVTQEETRSTARGHL